MRVVTGLALLAVFCAAGGAAGETAEVPSPQCDREAYIAELQRRIRCQEALIEQLERQAEEADSYIPHTNVRLSPTLRDWRDLLFRRDWSGNGSCGGG